MYNKQGSRTIVATATHRDPDLSTWPFGLKCAGSAAHAGGMQHKGLGTHSTHRLAIDSESRNVYERAGVCTCFAFPCPFSLSLSLTHTCPTINTRARLASIPHGSAPKAPSLRMSPRPGSGPALARGHDSNIDWAFSVFSVVVVGGGGGAPSCTHLAWPWMMDGWMDGQKKAHIMHTSERARQTDRQIDR